MLKKVWFYFSLICFFLCFRFVLPLLHFGGASDEIRFSSHSYNREGTPTLPQCTHFFALGKISVAPISDGTYHIFKAPASKYSISTSCLNLVISLPSSIHRVRFGRLHAFSARSHAFFIYLCCIICF